MSLKDRYGFNALERACIYLRIPESGDTELDAMIRKARRQEIAAKAMQGAISPNQRRNRSWDIMAPEPLAKWAVIFSDALIAELDREDEVKT